MPIATESFGTLNSEKLAGGHYDTWLHLDDQPKMGLHYL
jgi:hypothetical protein